ncbi:MGMT family protein [Candidatus Woesearchaeota archaeon]|nr:MGMT family protein [Candidatus Woesearchaeota archaeon]
MKFSDKVYELVKKIPKGKVTTYKEIASVLGTNAYRAVGIAMSKNTDGFLSKGKIPCHRIVASDGSIGGFCGVKTGKPIKDKKKLLIKEEIKFEKNKIINFSEKLFRF